LKDVESTANGLALTADASKDLSHKPAYASLAQPASPPTLLDLTVSVAMSRSTLISLHSPAFQFHLSHALTPISLISLASLATARAEILARATALPKPTLIAMDNVCALLVHTSIAIVDHA
jgi:hypothetical protein